MQKLKLLIIFIFGYFSFSFADESITITTYYPSPWGSYNDLTVANTLGIGTQSPLGKVHIHNTVAYNTAVTATGQDSLILYGGDIVPDGTYFGGITWISGLMRRAGIASVKDSISPYLRGLAFFTRAPDSPYPMNESMRISSNGNVGIGTTNPSYLLDVGSGTYGYNNIRINGGTATANGPYLAFAKGGLDKFYLSTSASLVSDGSDDIAMWTNGAWNMRFYTNGIERMRILSSGNVGIGTVSPNSSKGTGGYIDSKDVYLRDTGKWASEGGISYTYYCFTNSVYGTPVCTNAGGTRGYCPSGYTQKLALGSWGACTDCASGFGYLLPTGGSCGPACPAGLVVGSAYICSQ